MHLLLGDALCLVLVDALGFVLVNAQDIVLVDMLKVCNSSCKKLKYHSSINLQIAVLECEDHHNVADHHYMWSCVCHWQLNHRHQTFIS